jgi:protein MpaA
MKTESTAGGEELLEQVRALGWAPIGRSTEGRVIVAARLPGADGGGSLLLLMAGIHGNEPASVAAVLDFIDCGTLKGFRPSRDEATAGNPPAPHALAGGVAGGGPVWVVPALNPDGLLINQKDSARGVDLNRNVPARNWRPDHPPGYHPGRAPLSEPEAACFAALVEHIRPRAVVAVHAPFACINHDGPAAGWAATVAAACGWPAQADIGYPTPGSLGSWLGVARGLPVLTIELPPGGYAGFRDQARRALGAAVRGPM